MSQRPPSPAGSTGSAASTASTASAGSAASATPARVPATSARSPPGAAPPVPAQPASGAGTNAGAGAAAAPQLPATTGHVFVIQANIVKLNCDAMLIPAGGVPPNLSLGTSWLSYPYKLKKEHVAYTKVEPYMTRLDLTPLAPAQCRKVPRKYIATVSATGPEEARGMSKLDRLVLRMRRFVEAATHDLRSGRQAAPPRARRERHLLAVPLLGSGGGGEYWNSGTLIRSYMTMLYEQVKQLRVDVVMCMFDSDTYEAAQAERRTLAPDWPLSKRLMSTGRRLARLATAGELVLFIGAGVSTGAGLPMWVGLIDKLATAVGIGVVPPAAQGEVRTPEREAQLARMAAARKKDFAKLNLLDQALLIEQRLSLAGRSLGQTVAAMLLSPFHSVAHSLLAKLPVTEHITTNYDALFELAIPATDTTLSVLPHAPLRRADKWILKMHGCVTRVEDIVLTRTDYSQYANNRAALGGILQALLLTKHMAFIGFSVSDDNFHRLFDSVRRHLQTASHPLYRSLNPAAQAAFPDCEPGLPLPHQTRRSTNRRQARAAREEFQRARGKELARRSRRAELKAQILPAFDLAALDEFKTGADGSAGSGSASAAQSGGQPDSPSGAAAALAATLNATPASTASAGADGRDEQRRARRHRPRRHRRNSRRRDKRQPSEEASEKLDPDACNTPVEPRSLGTVLSFWESPTQVEMWQGHLHFVPIHRDHGDPVANPSPSTAALARSHDIILDYIGFQCAAAGVSHLLNDRFVGVLSEADSELRAKLTEFMVTLPPKVTESTAFRSVKRLVKTMGGRIPFHLRAHKRSTMPHRPPALQRFSTLAGTTPPGGAVHGKKGTALGRSATAPPRGRPGRGGGSAPAAAAAPTVASASAPAAGYSSSGSEDSWPSAPEFDRDGASSGEDDGHSSRWVYTTGRAGYGATLR